MPREQEPTPQGKLPTNANEDSKLELETSAPGGATPKKIEEVFSRAVSDDIGQLETSIKRRLGDIKERLTPQVGSLSKHGDPDDPGNPNTLQHKRLVAIRDFLQGELTNFVARTRELLQQMPKDREKLQELQTIISETERIASGEDPETRLVIVTEKVDQLRADNLSGSQEITGDVEMSGKEWEEWRDASPNKFKNLKCPRCGKETPHLPIVDIMRGVVCQGGEQGGCWLSHKVTGF